LEIKHQSELKKQSENFLQILPFPPGGAQQERGNDKILCRNINDLASKKI